MATIPVSAGSHPSNGLPAVSSTPGDSTHNHPQYEASSAVSPEEELSFAPGDSANPRNWPEWRKWSIVIAITLIDLTVSWGASGYSPAEMKMEKLFHVGAEVGTLGLSLYVLGLALGPMSPIYIISYGIFLLFLLGTALVKDVGGFLVLRFLSGVFAAVTIANFGGTIADLWPANETGPAMSVFLWAATCGSPSGYFLFAFVAANRGFRDVFWALLGILGGFWILMCLTLQETRHNVIITRMQRKTGQKLAKDDVPRIQRIKKASQDLMTKALKRPFLFLFTEGIIMFGSIYNGYLYGLSYLFNSAFVIVFGPQGHGFGTIDVGLCFLGLCVGITIGPITNAIFQEPYFQRHLRRNNYRNTPEARVMLGKVAAVTFPVSLFWFAWTSYKSIHWIVPILASALWGWSFYTLILMTYTYTEDSYKTFSASALAGIGLVRNVAGAGFPLFGTQMYHRLGNQGATSLLAGLAVLMVPIPFVLSRYGSKLRKNSPWASQHILSDEREGEGADLREEVEKAQEDEV